MSTLAGGTFVGNTPVGSIPLDGFVGLTDKGDANLGYFRSFWFSISEPTIDRRIIGTATGSVNFHDRVLDYSTYSVAYDYTWNYTYESDRDAILAITHTSEDTGIITPDVDPYHWTSSNTDTGNNSVLIGNILSTTINSPDANFTSADIGKVVVSDFLDDNTYIVSVSSTTQATISPAAIQSGLSTVFTVLNKTPNVDLTLSTTLPQSYVREVTGGSGSGTIYTFDSWRTNSVAENIADTIDNAISGLTPSVAWPIYSSINHGAATYVRNTSFWGAGLDFTPVAVYNSNTGGQTKAGTLISPRHIILASHYAYGVGTTVRFVKGDNTTVTRTVTQASFVTGSYDAWVCILDSDVPAGINFCRVLPEDFFTSSKLYSTDGGNIDSGSGVIASSADRNNNYRPFKLPWIRMNQYSEALIGDVAVLADTSTVINTTAEGIEPTDATRLSFYKDLIVNDSGSPGIVFINDIPVILTAWTAGGGGGSQHYACIIDLINTTMHDLSVLDGAASDYQLTAVDLSGFTTY